MSAKSETATKPETLTGEDILKALKSGKPLLPIYYLFGDEPHQLRDIVAEICGRVQPAFRDFNLHQVTGGEVSGAQINGLAQQLPVMDQQSVVLVREAGQMAKSDWEQLEDYLAQPSSTTCLIFLDAAAELSLDGRTKTAKLLKNALVRCRKPFDTKIPAWLQQRSRNYNLRLHADAISLLIERLGTDLSALDHALQRLALYVGGSGAVTEDIVDTVIVGDREFNVFELIKYIGRRQLEPALRFLRGALQRGESPLAILALLSRSFRDLVVARVRYDQGEQSPQAFNSFLHPKLTYNRDALLREFLAQVKAFSLTELRRAIQLFHSTDLRLKSTSGLSPETIMEQLVFELCLPVR